MMLLVRYGEHGPRVVLCQLLLNRTGAALAVDGIFGRHTRDAVREFRRGAGLGAGDAVDPAVWDALPRGSDMSVVDVIDYGDPAMAGPVSQALVAAGSRPIQFGLMCAGVEQMVASIAGAASPGSIALLRIQGHGNLGQWMTVSVGDVVHGGKAAQAALAKEDHSYIAATNFRKLAPVLAQIGPYFAPHGSMEHGGCSLGSKPATRQLMHDMADLWNAPVSAGIGIQVSALNIDGQTFTAYPLRQTLKTWSQPFR